MHVAVIDYDCGNLFSLTRALERFPVHVSVTDDPDIVSQADRVILPGVGAYGEGMKKLRERRLVGAITAFAASGKPLLGICLGMQLLVDSSEEFGVHQGLGLIPGKTVLLQPVDGAKVPHVGWNSLWMPPQATPGAWKDSMLKDVPEGKDVYFVHSFVVVPAHAHECLAVTRYGGVEFVSVIKSGNITGCQFHPEKSGKHGVKMIEHFLEVTHGSHCPA